MWTVHVVRKFASQEEAEAFADSMMDTVDSPSNCIVEMDDENDNKQTEH